MDLVSPDVFEFPSLHVVKDEMADTVVSYYTLRRGGNENRSGGESHNDGAQAAAVGRIEIRRQ